VHGEGVLAASGGRAVGRQLVQRRTADDNDFALGHSRIRGG
jgi:hypothetical protein